MRLQSTERLFLGMLRQTKNGWPAHNVEGLKFLLQMMNSVAATECTAPEDQTPPGPPACAWFEAMNWIGMLDSDGERQEALIAARLEMRR